MAPDDSPFHLCGGDKSPGARGKVETYFAPAGRSSPDELEREQRRVLSVVGLQPAIDAMPICAAILNEHRQIVLANRSLLELLKTENYEVLGRRLGEALGCAYWKEAPDGCGTGLHCMACGAVAAIWQSQQTRGKSQHDCQFMPESPDGSALDLRVTATVIEVGDSDFVICVVENVGEEKRLQVLSRTFFHDVMNTAVGIKGYSGYVASQAQLAPQQQQSVDRLSYLANLLVEEIAAHRDLTLAESGELMLRYESAPASAVLEDLRALYQNHSITGTRKIVVGATWGGKIAIDLRLLRRVLGNMIQNALEASAADGVVTIGCERRGKDVLFTVHNSTAMPAKVQLQMFKRSFTTKEQQGHGIGAYSMKLLGERYLGGKVSFTSDEASGTTFTLSIPKE
jgi:hypothetical protein